MNTLLAEIVRSLKELQLGFAGELTMSDAMEGLMDALYLDKVRVLGVPSRRAARKMDDTGGRNTSENANIAQTHPT